jgi:hypothetical protein
VLGDHRQEGWAVAVELCFTDTGNIRHFGTRSGSDGRQFDQRLVVENDIGRQVLRARNFRALLP